MCFSAGRHTARRIHVVPTVKGLCPHAHLETQINGGFNALTKGTTEPLVYRTCIDLWVEKLWNATV